MPTGSFAPRAPRGARFALTRATETLAMPSLAERHERRSGRLPSCRDQRGFPHRRSALAFVTESFAQLAHRSHLGAAVDCVSTSCGELLGQRRAAELPCGFSSVVTRDASDRLLPSHVLRTSTHASSVLDASCAFAPARSRRSSVSHQSDSLRRAARSLSGCHRGGRCLPAAMRADRASDIPVASPTAAHCARALAPP